MKKKKNKRNSISKSKSDSYLPSIDININSNKNNSALPKIVYDKHINLSEKDRTKLVNRLLFIDPKELYKLSLIRIVDEKTIKLPSKQYTNGRYYKQSGKRKAEIQLSISIFKEKNIFKRLYNWMTFKDGIFETLYHEIGHHKVSQIHSISGYKNEAYAEKFMFIYKKEWFRRNIFQKIIRGILKIPFKLIWYLFYLIYYAFRNRSDFLNLLFRRYYSKEISEYEFQRLLYQKNESKNKDKKWEHPLNNIEYREKFNLKSRK